MGGTNEIFVVVVADMDMPYLTFLEVVSVSMVAR